MKPQGWEEALYAALLRLYPERFRDAHGQDAIELFRDRLREARRGRRVGRFLTRAFADAAFHGILERVAALGSLGPRGDSAVRRLRRRPAQTALIVGILAVGVGGCITMMTLLRGAVLSPLPYPEADRLLRIWERNDERSLSRESPSPGNFLDWEDGLADVAVLAAWHITTRTLRDGPVAEELRTTVATHGFFRVLGTDAALGRVFEEDEVVRNGPGAVLSHGAWTELYGAEEGVVGSRIALNDELHTVLGVLPEGFAYPDPSVDLWTTWHPETAYANQPEVPRGWRFVSVAGRLHPGVSLDQFRLNLERIQEDLAVAHPEENAGWSVAVQDFRSAERGPASRPLWLAMGAAALILLAAIVDISMILFAGVPLRRQELAVRVSLGARRADLFGLLARESLVLGLLGGAGGLALAALFLWAGRGVIAPILAGAHLPVDGWTALLALGVAVGATVAFALTPALESARVAPASVLRSSDGRSTGGPRHLGDLFVGLQTCLAVILLGTCAALAADLSAVLDRDPGFDPEGLSTFRISLSAAPGSGPGATADYYRSVLDAVRAEPDVLRASAVQTFPLHPVQNDPARPVRLPGSGTPSAEAPVAQVRIITPDYFTTMGTPLLAGAGFSGDEVAGGEAVAVLSETTARSLWAEGASVGRTVEIDFRGGWAPYRVVGVVPDTRHYGLQEATRAEVYLSHAQVPYLPMNIILRTDGTASDLQARMERIVRAVGPGQPIHGFARAEDLLAASWTRERLLLVALVVFAVAAFLLTVAGVYGVTALSVNRRAQEMGIRIALGAYPGRVRRMVVARAVRWALAGTLLGALGAWGGALVATRMLPDAPEAGAWAVPAAALTMLLAAALSAFVPARRVARGAGTAALKG